MASTKRIVVVALLSLMVSGCAEALDFGEICGSNQVFLSIIVRAMSPAAELADCANQTDLGNLEVELSQLGEDATEDEIEAHRNEWQERHDRVIGAGGLG